MWIFGAAAVFYPLLAFILIFARGHPEGLAYDPDWVGAALSALRQSLFVFLAGAATGLLYWFFAGRPRPPYGKT